MSKIENSNMDLWNKVMGTDPAFTKEVGFGRKFTSINAHYQVRELTRAFGQIGRGWGISNEQFYSVDIGGLLCYQAVLWYVEDGNTYQYDINSSIATHNSKGRLDDECFKKVSTDALTKGLSKLGFNADIFLGMWDDNKYVAAQTESHTKKDSLTDVKYKAMLKAIESGKGDVVKSKMKDYALTTEQSEALNKALA
tara:strand:- start:2696 stop:3283 length:588 start_codon:yes stop_codon:yes gene_type:complete